MQAPAFVFLFINIIGFLDKSGLVFNLSGTKGVSGKPIRNYPTNPQFYPDAVIRDYYHNNGTENVYDRDIVFQIRDYYHNNGTENVYDRDIKSQYHRLRIANPYMESQVLPNIYQIFVYKKDNFNKDRDQFPFQNIALSYAPDNEFEVVTEEYDDYFYEDVPENIVKEHKFFKPYVSSMEPLHEDPPKHLKPQHFENYFEQNKGGSSTTEQIAILGLPIVIPTTEANPDRVVFYMSSETPTQKQCVQDCQSSSAYSPVCGTNNVTFFNEEKFVCARNCGINVVIAKRGECT